MVDLTMLNTRDTMHGHVSYPVPSCIVSRAVMYRIPCRHASYPVLSCIASRVHHVSHPVFIMYRIPCSSCIVSRAVMHRIPCLFSAFPLGQIAFLTGCDGITSLGHHKIGMRINLP